MSQPKVSSVPAQHATIFVVDDEPLLLDLAAAILEPLGYDVRTFRDPQMALTQLTTVKPALVVTDYAMGKMSGMDLIHECKRLIPDQKTMLVSGGVDEQIYEADPIKPDLFLAKPYQIDDLIALVRQLVGP